MTIDHILVATDLSSEGASCWAPVVELARATGARITLLHVVAGHAAIPHGAPTAPPLPEPTDPSELEEARAGVEAERAKLGKDVSVETAVIAGVETATAVTDYANENDVDLIAVATHGRTGFRHLVLGSVAEGVVRRSTVPVLVFPRQKR